MWPVFPLTETLVVVTAVALLIAFASRVVQPEWWRSRIMRGLALFAVGILMLGFASWIFGEWVWHRGDLVRFGAATVYITVLTLMPAALVMPFAAAADRVLLRKPALAMMSSSSEDKEEEKNAPKWRRNLSATRMKVSRRAMIRFGTASIPTMAAMTGASGFAQAKREPTMPIIRLRYPGLHPDLEGLKILQLSDLHLGAGCLDLDDLKRGLEIAFAARKPDLIVLTGDVADDPALIPGALRLVAEANARYGALACLGNHEYLHDISITRPKFEAGPIPLLVGAGRALRIGRATLFVGGSDDPVHMHGEIAKLLKPSIASAASDAPANADFRLLLCHRPEGFGPATELGFDLTLSGHTHGGQLGMFGRSLLEKIRPGIGWWGSYSKKGLNGRPSRLYTTSGFGHWFPFRVGCPTEMPLLVLEGSSEAAAWSNKLEA